MAGGGEFFMWEHEEVLSSREKARPKRKEEGGFGKWRGASRNLVKKKRV